MKTIWLINGPNLNLLGTREPEIYGRQTLADIESACASAATELGFLLKCHQSNHEGELVTLIQQAGKQAQGLLLNAGAYTHTSIAILDALSSLKLPVIEIHMSNIFRRESFRHESYVSKAAAGIICGFGAFSYLLGVQAMARLLDGGE